MIGLTPLPRALQGCDFDTLLLTLSQLRLSLKHLQIADDTSAGKASTSWRPPDSFSRRTLKYWVWKPMRKLISVQLHVYMWYLPPCLPGLEHWPFL